MSFLAKLVLGSSCLFSVTVISYVHYKQSADRQQLYEGVLRDNERRKRKSENVHILQQQQLLTEQLKKEALSEETT
ncbi:protein PET117 homolog, mitochondrial [Coccinella septempunctata]|uniref:protein PET117 homolog, mitochondrial n=1 Tax=Coccinella septempunctata TaxID=41139 RepID=UPI001D0740C9|nr:protein PET117 homolog, mitochondrial [Coccinella septempunctata]